MCLHAGNTREEIDALVNASVAWAKAAWAAAVGRDRQAVPEGGRTRIEESVGGIVGLSRGEFLRSKL